MLNPKQDYLIAALQGDLLLKEIQGHPAFKNLAEKLNIELSQNLSSIAEPIKLAQRIASTMRFRHLDIPSAINYIECFDINLNPPIRSCDLATEIMATVG